MCWQLLILVAAAATADNSNAFYLLSTFFVPGLELTSTSFTLRVSSEP